VEKPLSARSVLVGAFFVAVAVLSICKVRSFDPPWVVAAGESTLAAGHPLERDPFSYTSQQPWMHHEWLTEVTWAALYRAGGWTLLCIIAGLLVALTVFIVRSTSPGRVAIGALVPCAVLAAGLRETADPIAQLFSDLLFAATLKLLLDDERRGAVPRWKLAAGLLAIQLLWTQLHGGNPTGVTLIGAWFLAGPSLFRAAVTAGAALLTCAGPYGVRVHGHFFAHPRSVTFLREFQPLRAALDSGSLLHWAFVIWVVVAAVALLSRMRSGERVRFEAIALCAFLAVTVLYVRIATETAILATAAILPVKWPQVKWSSVAGAPAAAAVFLACIAFSSRPFGFGLEPARFPLATLAFLRSAKPPGPMFNAYNYGGLLLKDFPDEKVFIDGRAFIVYSEQQMVELVAVYEHPPKFAALDARYHFRLVVLPAAGRSLGLLRWLESGSEWKRTFSDGIAVVLTRNG
jgi:hypothetical protein